MHSEDVCLKPMMLCGRGMSGCETAIRTGYLQECTLFQNVKWERRYDREMFFLTPGAL